MSTIRIFVVDDHTLLRAGVKLLINAQSDMQVVGEAGTLQQAIDTIAAAQPDVVTLDLSMPGGAGVAGVQRLLSTWPSCKVLVLTMHDDAAYIRSAMAMGASGYVVKSVADTELIMAIRAVHRGRVFVDVQSASAMEAAMGQPGSGGHDLSPLSTLSEREREVLIDVAAGYTSAEIAERIGLSPKTVESYRARLMHKLGLKGRADLVRLATDAGLHSVVTRAGPPGE